jgi:hypothetical protein
MFSEEDVVEVDPSKIAEIDENLKNLPTLRIKTNVRNANEEEVILKVIIKHLLKKLNVTSIAQTVDLIPEDVNSTGSFELFCGGIRVQKNRLGAAEDVSRSDADEDVARSDTAENVSRLEPHLPVENNSPATE